MSKLNELQKKYEKAKYEPDENCSKCGGRGEFHFPGNQTFKAAWMACHCIYISHDFLPVYKEVMSATLSKIKGETK